MSLVTHSGGIHASHIKMWVKHFFAEHSDQALPTESVSTRSCFSDLFFHPPFHMVFPLPPHKYLFDISLLELWHCISFIGPATGNFSTILLIFYGRLLNGRKNNPKESSAGHILPPLDRFCPPLLQATRLVPDNPRLLPGINTANLFKKKCSKGKTITCR